MKTCNQCNQEKLEEEFSSHIGHLDKLSTSCLLCIKASKRSYSGKLYGMYRSQFSTSRQRGQVKPNYLLKEFILWAESQDYIKLHQEWVDKNYIREAAPSADRLNDNLPYTLNNLRLVTWLDNKSKAHKDFKAGILINNHKEIVQLTKARLLIAKYCSITDASRATGIERRDISANCNNRQKTAKGFIWEFI